MALSAAEKQRRYREKRDNDPERRAKFLKQQKERYQSDKELGRRKLVSDMTAREKRHQRRYWKEKQRISRQRRKAESMAVNMTPPQSPENNIPVQPGPSRQFKQAKRKKMRETSKLYREKNVLLLKLRASERKAEMYRKRWERLKGSKKSGNPETPRTKTRRLLRCFSSKTVRKTLDFHHVLVAQLRENCKQRSKKIAVARLITGNIMKKYRFTECSRKEIGVNMNRNQKCRKKGSLSLRLHVQVRHYFERDDVSRVLTGKKRTVTKKKIKKQKRLLLDTVENLYKKFVAETNKNISFTTFWRLKPFWIKAPSQKERETCICRTCDNVQMKANALSKAKVIDNANMANILRSVVCSKDNQSCMYGKCQSCNMKCIPTKDHAENEKIKWQEWKTIKENRTIKKDKEEKVKGISITKKITKDGTIKELKENFHLAINKYKEQQYNINNQYNHYRHKKQNLKDNECFIHIDFSENYVGKLAKETSSMHYGASQPQITLHTGFYQVGNKGDHVLFATVSDSLQHGPAAIWAFMIPILEDIKTRHPGVDYIHFYSDGPSTQYRQKNNFFLLSTEIFALGYKGASWNFHEAGHGKGIPDGIGGTLKRAADRRVLYGADITSSSDFITELEKSGTKVSLFRVEEVSIQKFEDKLKQQCIQTVPGTLRIHQIFVSEFGKIKYRDVSCDYYNSPCEYHHFKLFSFVKSGDKETGDKKATNRLEPDLREHNLSQKPVTTDQSPEQISEEIDATGDVFSDYLNMLSQCKTFEEVQTTCRALQLQPVSGKSRSVVEDNLCVDEKALDIYPEDYDISCFPVSVKADGDCLPACGSVFLYGNDMRSEEVRVRIINELALNIDFYLQDDNLRKGLSSHIANESLKNVFAMFSADFISGIALTDDTIRLILENEIKSICTPKSFMGIWQIFGLASVLQMPIYSVYPMLGEHFYRIHLNRILFPRISSSCHTAAIMWTSTRDDMVPINWKPNHFVPIIPIEFAKCNEPENVIEIEIITAQDEHNVGLQDCVEKRNVRKETNMEYEEQHEEKHNNVNRESLRIENEYVECNRVENENMNGPLYKLESEGAHGEQNINVENEMEAEMETIETEFERVDHDNMIKDKMKMNIGEMESGHDTIEKEMVIEESLCRKGESNGENKIMEGEEEVIESERVIQNTVENDGIEVEVNKCETVNVKGDSSKQRHENIKKDYLGRHVIVNYFGKLYPGIVKDVSPDYMYVYCMKKVRNTAYTYTWPIPQDKCWYSFEDVVSIIPDPKPKDGSKSRFEVDPDAWHNAISEFNA